MANLPSDRTKLNAAVANQQASVIASAQANREALIEAYDTIDSLNQKTDGLISSGLLSPVPPDFVKRQAIINGNFAINQRAKAGTVVLTAGQYGHDRWKAGAGGCTYTFATANNITTVTITAGSLVQIIEGLNLYGGTYTLSWVGTAQSKIGAGAYGNSGIKGTVIGGANLSTEFGVGTLSQVQLCAGEVALPFQPISFADELKLCQRYYQANMYFFGHANTASFLTFSQTFKEQMRITPTIATGVYSLNPYGAATLQATADIIVCDNKGITRASFSPANLTVGSGYGVQFTLDAEI